MGTVLDVYQPTAVQEVADVQDTPVSWLPCVVLGLGVGWTVQAEPSHASATVPSSKLLLATSPTASQELAVMQETLAREVLTGPGTAWAVHEVPFHATAAGPVFVAPTASQEVADRQEIEETSLSPGTGGPDDHEVPSQIPTCPEPAARQKLVLVQDTMPIVSGGAWIDQDVPFHISARGPDVPSPTASQNCEETQETPLSSLSSGEPNGFAGLAVG